MMDSTAKENRRIRKWRRKNKRVIEALLEVDRKYIIGEGVTNFRAWNVALTDAQIASLR